jgi:DNA gyrase subunit A
VYVHVAEQDDVVVGAFDVAAGIGTGSAMGAYAKGAPLRVIGAAITDGHHDVMLFSDAGKAVRFEEEDVRSMGRATRGVRGMMLEPGQQVIAMLVAADESLSVLTATEHGFGKRTSITEYTRHGRGNKGMIAIQTSDRNGKVVGAVLVDARDEVMLISNAGVLIRTRVADVREMGRATQGVTLIALDAGTHLAGIEKIGEAEDDSEALADGPEADDAGNEGNGNQGAGNQGAGPGPGESLQ